VALKLSNNAISRLASAITAGATSISVASGEGAKFPTLGAGDYFPATLSKADGSYEIVNVTARSGDTLTATRGQEGTTALSFSAGTLIELRLTAATVEDINTWTQSIYVDPATGITTIDGTIIPTSKTLLVSTDIGATVQAYDADLTTLGAGGSSARSFLGLAIGTDVQAYDAQLADVAGLTPTDNGVIIGNGANFVVESGATLRTSLGLAIGVDIQAYDADITTIANLSPTNGNVIKGNGTAWNSLPIQTLLTILNRSSATINIALANAFLPVLNRAGSTINVVTS